jgi:cytochrome c556
MTSQHGCRTAGSSRPTPGTKAVAAAIAVLLVGAPTLAQEAGAKSPAFTPLVSIKEVMEKTITPATNTLWNAFEPPTEDAQWVALEEAAVTLLTASNVVALGGTGPMDNEWARQPGWQADNQVMIDAGQDALEAVRARDHAALLAAGDVLYPPCEGCHQQFNPGVINAQ